MSLHTPHFTVISNLKLLGYCTYVLSGNRASSQTKQTFCHMKGNSAWLGAIVTTSQSLALIGDFTFYSAFSKTGATKTMKTNQMSYFEICPVKCKVQSNEVMMLTRLHVQCRLSINCQAQTVSIFACMK